MTFDQKPTNPHASPTIRGPYGFPWQEVQDSWNLRAFPCSAGKLGVPIARAAEMYAYHVAARRAASAASADGSALVLTLSAKFGRDEDRILHYDLRAGQSSTVSPEVLARQAHFLGVSAARVTVFAGKAYADLARSIWPALEHPLAGQGIGEQLAFFADLYRPSRTRGPARP